MQFEQNLENELVLLAEQLQSGKYKPQPSKVFIVDKPKCREVFAPDFRDRVVEHALITRLEKIWGNVFIYDSYACIKNKGTHAAAKRVRSFLRKASKNETKKCYYLQIDISNFFYSISQHILINLLFKKVKNKMTQQLIKTIIYSKPAETATLSNRLSFRLRALPPHKSLFSLPKGIGIPIGNLTSQFFANVYLNELDQFVKHTLKSKFYVRYCDDAVLISDSKEKLIEYLTRISDFLQKNLQLKLKTDYKLENINNGINFLGYIIRPSYMLVRRRVVNAARQALDSLTFQWENLILNNYVKTKTLEFKNANVFIWDDSFIKNVQAVLSSYLSHFSHANSYKLILSLKKQFPWITEYFSWRNCSIKRKYEPPKLVASLDDQIKFHRKHIKGHNIYLQCGNAWRLIEEQKEPHAPIALIAEICPKASSTFLIKRQLVARIVFNSNFSCSNLKT